MRLRTRWHGLVLALLVATLGAAPVRAQHNRIDPYLLIVFDTSSSMILPPLDVANSCDYTPTDKFNAAKCALAHLVDSTGEAHFGLMHFAQTFAAGTCSSTGCSPTSASAMLRVPIETNTTAGIRRLIDNTGTPGDADPNSDELCAPDPGVASAAYTPLGGTLLAAREYFEGRLSGQAAPTASDDAVACRPLAVILLTDGVECCDGCVNSGAFAAGCPKADAELVTAGVGGCSTACETVGDDNLCSAGDAYETAPERAYELRTESEVPAPGGPVSKAIATYVIGFGISAPNPRIERIAVGGGTDNPSDGAGGMRGFYAADESALSLALNQIIADAQPPAESCNGLDDDCDGAIDEAGNNACGGCGPLVEQCDGDDDDCDGAVDEDTAGDDCGSDVGRCQTGTLQCVAGEERCQGGVGPRDERCNCEDDDCDGAVDEDIDPDAPLCSNGVCNGCQCIPRCTSTVEFAAICPDGLTAEIAPSGDCLCVADHCDRAACARSTLSRDGEIACAPEAARLAECTCRAGQCVAPCDGVHCEAGDICDRRTGLCAEDSCRGLGCAQDQLCDWLEGSCVPDACAGQDCGAGRVCRGGTCEPSCADQRCASGQYCRAGACVPDPCAKLACAGDQVCDRERAACVANECPMSCPAGLSCRPPADSCELDPCWNVRCPKGQSCQLGECIDPDAAPAADPPPQQHIVATGSGGCAIGPAGPVPGASSLWLLALGLAALGLHRRRLRQAALLGVLVFAAQTFAGCEVHPFCVDCAEPAAATQTSRDPALPGTPPRPDAAADTPGEQPAADRDAGLGCDSPELERCDGVDNDCDLEVDEDVVADTNDCLQAGLCEGAKPECKRGRFACSYPPGHEQDETQCDGIDSDCDGTVDETFVALGEACSEGVGACQARGVQVCNRAGDGLRCQVQESAPAPSDELCDGIDNDCDGSIDEPRTAPGTDPRFVRDALQQIAEGLWMYTYEAARPDATDMRQGLLGTRACSRAGVLPWTNVTYADAVLACEAAGFRLCSDLEWRRACEGTNACAYSYDLDGCGAYPQQTSDEGAGDACNGHDLSAVPGGPDPDRLAPTGSYAHCFSPNQGGRVFDLSGNAEEWTAGSGGSTHPLRGGSYEDLPSGLRCDFTIPEAGDGVRLPSVGFRCCSEVAP